jgi:hypothetical protein
MMIRCPRATPAEIPQCGAGFFGRRNRHLCNVCHQSIYLRKSSTTLLYFQIVAWKFSSLQATALVGLSRAAVGCATVCRGNFNASSRTNNYVFQRQKRAVAIRRDGDDFVVSLMPNDLVIFRNESADALRKVCKGWRWAVVSDTAMASI